MTQPTIPHRRRRLLPVLALVLLTTCLAPSGLLARGGSLIMAPDFEAVDLEGRTVRLSELRGKVVLLDFWATWCRPCHAETPYLVRAFRKYSDRGLVILSISLDRDRGAVDRYLADHPKIGWRQILNRDSDPTLGRLYGVRGIPRHFLIDRDGALLASSSVLRGRGLLPSVRAALRGKFDPEPWAGLSPADFKRWRAEIGAVERASPGPLAGIEISPPVATLERGESRSFTVHGVDPQGRRMEEPVTARWSAGGGGEVDASGVFTAGAEPGLFPGAVGAWIEHGGAVMEATATVLVRRTETPTAETVTLETVALEKRPIYRFDLSRQGECCILRDFTDSPPSTVVTPPPGWGLRQRYTSLPFGEGELPIFIDEQEDGEYMVRIDLDRDGDLTDDPPERCNPRSTCGPFEVALSPSGAASQELLLTYFTYEIKGREHPVLWCSRATALVGDLGGRAVAVVDDDTNGRYDDADDLVLIDLDGDGTPSGRSNSSETFLRHSPLWLDGRVLKITEVSPAAGELRVADADFGPFLGRVLDVQTGRPVAAAKVRLHPGGIRGSTDGNGYFVLEVPEGRYDFVAVSAPGYWGRILQGEELDGHRVDGNDEPPLRVLLEPGPCSSDVLWCSRGAIRASAVENCQLDLETGVVGPRPGPRPGRQDIGWYAPPGGLQLSPEDSARWVHLGDRDFAAVSIETLKSAVFNEEKLFAGPECIAGRERSGEAPLLHPGSILGVLTAEGNYAKVRIDRCAPELKLSWVVYATRPSTSSNR